MPTPFTDQEIDAARREWLYRFVDLGRIAKSKLGGEQPAKLAAVLRTVASGVGAKVDLPTNSTPEDELRAWYDQLDDEFDRMELQFQLQLGRDRARDSYKISSEDKEKIKTLTSHIEDIIHKARLDEDRQEHLLNRLKEFLKELDRSANPSKKLVEIWFEVTALIGLGFENMKPALKLIDNIATIFGGALAVSDMISGDPVGPALIPYTRKLEE